MLARVRSRWTGAAVAAVMMVAGGAAASWRFAAPGTAPLDYGNLPVVTSGASGAFSCFCVVRLDALGPDDQFFLGKTTAGGVGWRLGLDALVDGSGAAHRVSFLVADDLGAATERHHASAATPGVWTTVGGSFEWVAPAAGAGAMTLYVDGTDDSAPPVLDALRGPAAHADPLTIGASPAGDGPAMGGAIGYAAIWDGAALTPDEHLALAAGADPRAIRPGALTFFARLEEMDGADLLGGTVPDPGPPGTAPVFDVDRWPDARPFIAGLGHPRPDAITVLTHVGRAAEHRIAWSLDTSYANRTPPITAAAETDFVVAHEISGLAPATTHHYRVEIDGAVVRDSAATFTTAPAGPAAFRFVFGSCTEFDHYSAALGYPRYRRAVFDGALARAPDFAVHSGDAWYSDTGGSDAFTAFSAWSIGSVEAFNRKAMQMLGARTFAGFQRRVPLYMMPDDHEFRNDVHQSHRGTVRWERAFDRVLHWQFLRNPPRTMEAVARDGLWYTFTYGGVDFFFIDIRTQRGVNGDPGTGTMLGNTPGLEDGQLGELLAFLDASTAPFQVILSPGMLSDRGTTGLDSWRVAFPDDQQQVIDALAARPNVVYFAGDVHWSGVIRLAASDDGDPAHDLYEMVGGPYRGHVSEPPNDALDDVVFTFDGGAVTPERYGYLVVDVDAMADPATMTVAIVSHDPVTGAETIEYTHPPLTSRPRCPGDLDRDGSVAFGDLLRLLAAWGPCDLCAADLDADGVVAFRDLLLLLARWGACG
jgi:phosphodiesterase/alkaline phosphatase D-like protein